MDADDVRKLALLARLRLSDAEVAQFGPQIGQILEFVHQLSELDTADVEPMTTALDVVNRWQEDRVLPGHSEGDLIFGTRNSQIATPVERFTRYVMLVKVDSKDTETVINALIKHSHKLPQELYQSLTWDRGSELADHKRFTLATAIKVYFCDPQSPWQRGSNEYTNGLLRQYFPKGTDLSLHSQTTLNAVARQLNGRPRKTLNYRTPADCFNQCVATIH